MIRIIFLLQLLFSGLVFSQDLETDRPDQTESSAIVPKRTLQIESGVGLELNKHVGGGINRTFMAPTVLLRLGLTPWFEFRAVNTVRAVTKIDYYYNVKNWEIDDLELGGKFQLYSKEDGNTQIAFLQHVSLPTSLASSFKSILTSKLLVSHSLGNRFSLGYNLGFMYVDQKTHLLTYSLALNSKVAEKVGIYAEVYGDFKNVDTGESSLYTGELNVDAGFTYLIKDNMQLDYSFGFGITNRMNYQALGFSMRLPK